jgi:hypothetical protein
MKIYGLVNRTLSKPYKKVVGGALRMMGKHQQELCFSIAIDAVG